MCFVINVVGSNVGAGDQQKPDYEFNVWTKPDCAGTSYENRNRCACHYSRMECRTVGHLVVACNVIEVISVLVSLV